MCFFLPKNLNANNKKGGEHNAKTKKKIKTTRGRNKMKLESNKVRDYEHRDNQNYIINLVELF